MENAIKMNQVSIGYNEVIVIDDLSISFPKGKIVSIIGANGCGKSTILKAIGRIIAKKTGRILVDDHDITKIKSKELAKVLSILPQSPQAPATLTCFELVSYGRFPYQKGLGKLSLEDKQWIDWAFQVINMSSFKNRTIANLSGGQRQRIWIAMALAQQTDIIMLDEPTTYLDLCHQLEILNLLTKLNKENNTTIIMVLHDINLAARYSDYLVAMKDGKVFNYGLVQEVFKVDMLRECFGIDGEMMMDPKTNKPVCISYELLKEI